ncbi:MAG: alginate export family protein [Alphaproteobacteria bacterium]|nr:alginate export family protein [Alphaproteobacteria bacterium]
MNRLLSLSFLIGCSAVAVGAFSSSAYAEPEFNFTTDLKAQFTVDENDDLGTRANDTRDAQAYEVKFRAEGKLTDHVSVFGEARAVENNGDGGSVDSDTGESSGREDFVELRQYWIEYSDLFDANPLAIRVGRQRIRDDYSVWWNRDLDAVTLRYDATLFSGLLAVGENLTEYRSSGDAFNRDDEDLFRVLGQTSWQYARGHYIEGRFAYQDDHSGMEGVGALVSSDDRDEQDGDLWWFGARLKGDVYNNGLWDDTRPFKYRADIMYVTGDEDVQTSTAGPGNLRTVSSVTNNDVSGWGMDLGAEFPLPVYQSPVLILGYAYGSGDETAGDGNDDSFRQTGLDGNSSRLGVSSGSLNNYGSVLRPDLSNIHILTAGLGVPLFKASDVSAIYRYYALDENATSLVSSGIDATLNGTDRDLGQGLDIVLNVDLREEFGSFKKSPFKRIGFKTTLGMFNGGDAFGAGEGETAYRAQMEFRFRF